MTALWVYRGAEFAPNAVMKTDDLALTAAGVLTRFVILHVTASNEPAEPTGRPGGCPDLKDILSSVATASKVIESEGKLVGELT